MSKLQGPSLFSNAFANIAELLKVDQQFKKVLSIDIIATTQ